MNSLRSLLGSTLLNGANLLVYVAIIVLFIVGIVTCIMPVIHNRGKLARAVRNIKAGQKARYSWQEDGFLGRGSLMAHWSAYLNNLFFADGSYHNASNVEDFINEETVIYGPGRSAFADALPTLLVSLGFLGTLIGLARGLSGFNMTDAAAAQSSIMTLIPSMKYAFTTSIFGVVGSVLFTLITRAVYGSTEHTLRSFYGAMSRYAGVASVDPLTQVAIYQQEQTALIQTMSKDLNGAFTENITAAIRNAVEPLNQSIKGFMTVTSQDQMRFLDAVVMRFVDRMDEVVGGKLKEFGRVLETTNRNQQEAFASVRANLTESEAAVRDLRSVQRIASEMASSISTYLEKLQANAKKADEGYHKIAGTVEQMNIASAHQAAYLKTLTDMQADLVDAADQMTAVVSGFTSRFTEENAVASRAMQAAAQELRTAGGQLQSIQIDATRALREEFDSTMDTYRDYVNQFTERVDYLAQSISDALSGMPKAVSDTSDQFLDEVDQLTKTLELAQRAINDAVDRLYRQ